MCFRCTPSSLLKTAKTIVSRLCEFTYSDETECPKPAKHHFKFRRAEHWYCTEHYDSMADYYRRTAHTDAHNADAARRVRKDNNL